MTKQEFVTELDYNVIEEIKEAILNTYKLSDEELKELEGIDEYNLDEFLDKYDDAEPPLSMVYRSREELAEGMLNDMNDEESIELWNEYCEDYNDPDGRIYPNDEEFFSLFGDVMEVVRAISYGDYNFSDNYVYFNGYGNLETFNYYGGKDCPVSQSDLINWLID
jgi:hypothetical protein